MASPADVQCALDPEQMGVVWGFSLRRGDVPYLASNLTWVPPSTSLTAAVGPMS